MTIGLGYILHSIRFGLWGVALFFAGHILADLLWYGAVSAVVWGGRNFLSDRFYRFLVGGCAGFLVVFAALFVYSGASRFFS